MNLYQMSNLEAYNSFWIRKPLKAIMISVMTFGFGYIFIARSLIRLRNTHFLSQRNLSIAISNTLRKRWGLLVTIFMPKGLIPPRSVRDELLWTTSSLISITFVYPLGLFLLGLLQYLLVKDLSTHESWENVFLRYLSFIGVYHATLSSRMQVLVHRKYYLRFIALLIIFTTLLVAYLNVEFFTLTYQWHFLLPKAVLVACIVAYSYLMYLSSLWWLLILNAYRAHISYSEKYSSEIVRIMSGY